MACLLLAVSARAQDSPSLDNVPTAQLRGQIEMLLATKRYGELIVPLQEYVKRLEEKPDPAQTDELERLSYSLAYCYFSEGREAESSPLFQKYLEKFSEKNPTRTGLALDILSASLFGQGRYEEATPLFERILARKFTTPERAREVRSTLVDCYVLPGNWKKAIPFLENAITDKSDLDFFGQCVVYLSQGYIETDRVEKVFELLPDLEQSGSVARYSVRFNLAVLQGADKLFQQGRVDLALPLFLIVAPKPLVETWLGEQTDIAKGRREAAKALASEAGAASIVAANERLRRLEDEAKLLAQTKSYDEELRHRIAQAYFHQSRTWEALWVYESIMEDFPESQYGEDAAYAGFALAASLGLLERASDFGAQYLEQYPEGKFYDDVANQLAQIYVEMRRFPDVVEVARSILDKRPDSLFADRLLFLSGFSLFQEEKFEEAFAMFSELRTRYPQSEMVAEADYWKAMTLLFRSDYPQALESFKAVASAFPETIVGIDSKFRAAVCLYALENYGEAKAALEAFVKEHPRSPQVAEAQVLLGDIAGADGRLDDALAHYARVESLTLNQGQIDYAALQTARVLETQEKFPEMEAALRAYLERYGTTGMYAEAIYRIGFAQKAQNKPADLLETYRSAIAQYGNDRQAIGIDLILRDYLKEFTQLNGHPPEEEARAELARARVQNLPALALRWQMAMDRIHSDFGVGQKVKLELKPELLDEASPATMIWIGRLAIDEGNKPLAQEAYERAIKEFPDSEWNEEALLSLARFARDEQDFETANIHYARLRELFPSSESAALAMEEQAQMLITEKKYREAIALLELILEVKEWRGEIWARTLFQIGKAKLGMGETAEAFAYFQRVYVLYAGYKEWAAKAYLESANCLKILGKSPERVATLREFVSKDAFKGLPEFAQAGELLAGEPDPQTPPPPPPSTPPAP
ncbi:MAG: tetratricopeptide repeat protein [Terrimicrobiaceae bacterium]